MTMPEPGWVNGDAFARGEIDECPECEEIAFAYGVCEECGYDSREADADALYDMYKDDLAMAFYDDEEV